MGNYKDRGIMKWAPFDALDGHTSMIEEMIFNINKIEKRTLSEDEFDELNVKLEEALKNKTLIYIEYYDDGYTYNTFGIIDKIDAVNKKLILESKETLDIDSILDINFEG